ncbi:MAG: tetraacyldisaccharide 4'-kinase [Hydrogenophaga sp.]|uniref:tetraacyldisaccharide 4'-kinase n=1 Tax=Hydrogenophaga sp. TaxID=1904254 RepID=UPI00276D92B8|nr:tetraacyldisaccharide 4'-kinase [Hydrogenophaga sp.]MDP2419154.1 tetraacyldisaccharide 4'-kinase [Hydrogenophaga sp.]MDZ4186549.1 tetraacyldisaccharide 4'-kinase [Hydrogenophaga sp.]
MATTREGSAGRQARWQAIAQRRGLYAWLLRPISWIYGALMALRKLGYAWGLLKSHQLPVPVIVVGNVVVGGAGKTPTVIALVQYLQTQGWRPGVVSRGYGRTSKLVVEVTAVTPAADSGDEPALIQRATGAPVFVARQRVAAAQALLKMHPKVNVLLCDDGLQHLALARDIAIAVFDERGCGNGWLLPAGLLREPWPPSNCGGYRPDVVLRQYREGAQPPDMVSVPGLPVFNAVRRLAQHAVGQHGQRIALEQLKGQALTAMAGIARPSVFFDMLRARGLTLARELPLPDHVEPAVYTALQQSETGPLICTEKDAVKCFALTNEADHAPIQIWAVPLELVPESGFFAAMDARLLSASVRCGAVNERPTSD